MNLEDKKLQIFLLKLFLAIEKCMPNVKIWDI